MNEIEHITSNAFKNNTFVYKVILQNQIIFNKCLTIWDSLRWFRHSFIFIARCAANTVDGCLQQLTGHIGEEFILNRPTLWGGVIL